MSKRKMITLGIIAVILAIFSVILSRMEQMFILNPNAVTLIVFALLASVIGFVIYGCIKGFENTFPNE